MKKVIIKTLVILSILTLTLTGCSKDEDSDPRDQFIGTYTYEEETTISFKLGTYEESKKTTGKGIFTIEKTPNINKIKLILADGSNSEYTVASNTCSNTYPIISNENNLILSGTGTDKGTINNNRLTIQQYLSGTITENGTNLTGTFKANGIIIAIKK